MTFILAKLANVLNWSYISPKKIRIAAFNW